MTLAGIVPLTACCGSGVQKQTKAKEAAAKDAKHIDTSVADILFVPVDAKVDPPPPIRTDRGEERTKDYIDGTTDIWFSIDADRNMLTRQVVQSFARRSWRQRTDEFLNPRIATSFARGWQHRCACLISRGANGQIRPRGQLFEWQGE